MGAAGAMPALAQSPAAAGATPWRPAMEEQDAWMDRPGTRHRLEESPIYAAVCGRQRQRGTSDGRTGGGDAIAAAVAATRRAAARDGVRRQGCLNQARIDANERRTETSRGQCMQLLQQVRGLSSVFQPCFSLEAPASHYWFCF